MTFDALIIGGGPAGATTALQLAKAGWSVALVEKKKFPRLKVCGEFNSATNLSLLEKLGLADFYLKISGPEIKRLSLFVGGRILNASMPAAICSQEKWGRALGREYLDTVLLKTAVKAGAKLWQPGYAKALRHEGDLFICTVEVEDRIEEILASIVIIAQGSWERSLNVCKIPTQMYAHQSSDLLAFKAHFTNCVLEPSLMPLLIFPGGYGGMVQSDNARVTLSCCIRRDVLQKVRQRYSQLIAAEAVFQHITAHCLGARQVLLHAVRKAAWLSAGPIRPGIRTCYANGIFYVGNIAGEAHPIIAEGISMAMQSAELLAQILIQHQKEILFDKVPTHAGKKYTLQWRSHFSKRIYAAAFFAQAAIYPRAFNSLLPILSRFPKFLTLGAKLSGKIYQIDSKKNA